MTKYSHKISERETEREISHAWIIQSLKIAANQSYTEGGWGVTLHDLRIWFKFMQQCTGKIQTPPKCGLFFLCTCVCIKDYRGKSQDVQLMWSINHTQTHHCERSVLPFRAGAHTHKNTHTLPSSWFFSSSCDSSCLSLSSTLPCRSSACRGKHIPTSINKIRTMTYSD